MAARSLSLAAYRALSRRRKPDNSPYAPRPEGELAWVHCADMRHLAAVHSLARRLQDQRPGCSVLVTSRKKAKFAADDGIFAARVPSEHPAAVGRFLQHWKPDIGLWLSGWLRPNLIDFAAARMPLLLLWAEADGFDRQRERWMPELPRNLLRDFRHLTASDAEARQKLVRLGVGSDRVALVNPLRATGQVLPCTQSDHDDLTAAVAGRPVWLAAAVEAAELPVILAAHRNALRRAHRLLLLLTPANAAARVAAEAEISASEFRTAHWMKGELPGEQHSILLTDDAEELGLWYRLAALSFLGGTLGSGHVNCNPLEPAALGSGTLYGPHTGVHLDAYKRLASAGAARIVNNAASLSTAVSGLITPDQAAVMAHAGWDIASEGGPDIDHAVALAQDLLDNPEGNTP